MDKRDWTGVFPAITTPFNENLSVDHDSIAEHVGWLMENGCTGIVALGSLGGSLAILASTTFLTLYTFSCHSLRHILGGRMDCFSCAVGGGPRFRGWSGVSVLNEHHMGLAWWSLLGVTFADFYVRSCSMGLFHDLRLL